jgi:hypothetical protein
MLNFLAVGAWSEHQVLARTTNQTSRKILPDVEASMDATWRDAQKNPDIHLFDGPLYRLESFHASPERLDLTLSPTTYRTFYGTNLHHPEFADRFGPDILANPVGVSPALVSRDNYLIFGRRNARVAYYPNRLHPFAGALDPRDAIAGESPNVFHALRRELHEELHFTPNDLADLRCLGLVQDQHIRQPELIFLARSTRSRDEIERSVDATEHGGSLALEATADSVRRAVEDPQSFTPIALATLVLFSRHTWDVDIPLPPH